MKAVRARPRRKQGLQARSATVLHGVCIYLDAGFLNGLRLRRDVQNALPNSTRYVQTINNVLVVVLTLAVRAHVDLFFRREIVRTRSRAP